MGCVWNEGRYKLAQYVLIAVQIEITLILQKSKFLQASQSYLTADDK